jgi:hypothetical protein
MKLGEPVLKLLSKVYEPSTMVEKTFGRYDMAFQTDREGRPVMLFMGSKQENGKIKGERFSRRLVFDESGKVIKDHWDNQGKI